VLKSRSSPDLPMGFKRDATTRRKMKENLKDIKGFEGSYQVSNLGRVKSLDRNIVKSDGKIQKTKGKLLKLKVQNTGYYEVTLKRNQEAFYKLVHRLVLSNFKHSSNLLANHIDGNKKNNNINNLEYTSHIENMKHWCTVLSGKEKYGVHFHKKNRKWIAQINIGDVPTYLGSFNDKEEAHVIYYLVYVLWHGVSPW